MVAPLAIAGLAQAFASLAPTVLGDESSGSQTTSGRTDTSTVKDSGQTSTQTSNNTTTVGPRTDIQGAQMNVTTGTVGPRIDTSSSTTTTSGRTDTQQLMITKEGIDNILRTILEGNQGLATVAKGVKAAGIYDSTTQQSQVNDLLTRAAGYAAEKSAKLVTTIGGTTSTTNTTNETGPQSTMQVQMLGDRANITGAQTTTTSGTDVLTTGPREQTSTNVKGAETVLSESEKKGLLDEIGIGGGATGLLKEVTKGVIGIPKTKWIVCTELHIQGRFDYRAYIIGSKYFQEAYDDRIKLGYYIWAEPAVRHLRKHPNSLYSRFLGVWFRARAEHIMKLKGYGRKKSILNPIAFYGTHAICWILSRTFARNYVPAESSYENPVGGGIIMAIGDINFGSSDSLLDAILGGVKDRVNQIEDTITATRDLQAVQKAEQLKQEENIAKAGITEGGEIKTPTMIEAEELAKMQAQRQTLKIATAMGTNAADASEILTTLAAEAKRAAIQSVVATRELSYLQNASLFTDPLGWMKAQFAMPSAEDGAAAAQAHSKNVQDNLANLQRLTQELPKTTAAVAQTVNEATIASKLEAVQARINLAVSDQKIRNAASDIQGLQLLDKLSGDQISALGTAFSAKTQEEHLKQQRAEFAMRQKEFGLRMNEVQERIAEKKANKDELEQYAGYVKSGLVQLGYANAAELPTSKIITLLNSKNPLYRDALNAGMLSEATGRPVVSEDASKVAEILMRDRVPLTANQEKIKELYKTTLSQVLDPKMAAQIGVDVTKLDQVSGAVGRKVMTDALAQHKSISYKNQDNIYSSPALDAIAVVPAVATDKWYSTVIAPQAVNMKEVNPDLVKQLTITAIDEGKISMNEAVKGMHIMYSAAAGLNNTTRNYAGLGLPKQTAFNALMDDPLVGKRTLNLMDKSVINTDLQKTFAARAYQKKYIKQQESLGAGFR